jgi:hypothetical protein
MRRDKRGTQPERAAAGESHRLEIAGELSISQSTVSTHIRKIYARLGAGKGVLADAISKGRRHGHDCVLPSSGALLLLPEAIGEDDSMVAGTVCLAGPVALKFTGKRDPADRLPASLGYPLQAGPVSLG